MPNRGSAPRSRESPLLGLGGSNAVCVQEVSDFLLRVARVRIEPEDSPDDLRFGFVHFEPRASVVGLHRTDTQSIFPQCANREVLGLAFREFGLLR